MRRLSAVLFLVLASAACQSDSRLLKQRVDPTILITAGPRVTELSGVRTIVPAPPPVPPDPPDDNGIALKRRDIDYEHIAFGVEVFTQEPGQLGWGYEGGFKVGFTETTYAHTDLDAQFYDVTAGVRFSGGTPDGARPFIGVGGVLTRDRFEQFAETDDDADPNTPLKVVTVNENETYFGLYMHTGALWRLDNVQLNETQGFLLGFDLRGVWNPDTTSLELALVTGWGH